MAEMVGRWYILYSDYTWGQTANESFTQIIESNGSSIIDRDAVPFPADDYTQYLNNVENSDADGLALLVAGLDQRLSMSQVLNEGMADQYTIAMHQLEDISLWGVGKEAAAVIDIASMGWLNTLDTGSDFKNRVTEEVGTSPFVRHYMGYMSADQLIRAANRAGSTAGADIVAELEGHTVSGPAAEIQSGSGDLYWRECDHQLIQPAHAGRGRSVDEMVDNPYQQWFEPVGSVAGDEAAPACADTGCSFGE
jgi:ABC-type branched-subunit amino acid transport system substrate-binding protein